MKRAAILIAALLLVPNAGLADVAPAAVAKLKITTATDVLAAFSAAGLPVQSGVVFSAATDPNRLLGRPGHYLSKASFYDARHPGGGDENVIGPNTVEVFATPAAAKARRDYIARVTQGSPILQQYLVLDGRVLARFDLVLLPAEVDEYRSALSAALASSKTVPVPAAKPKPRRPAPRS